MLPHFRKCTAFEGSQAEPACPSDNTTIKMKMGMGHWWNDTDRAKPKCSEKTLFSCHFVHHKSHMDWPGIELGPRPSYHVVGG